MEGYKEVYSTNDIIDLELVSQSLKNKGYDIFVKGAKALEVGNIELTGITGASIMVPNEDFVKARTHLVESKLDGEPSPEAQKEHRKIIITFVLLFILVAVCLFFTYT